MNNTEAATPPLAAPPCSARWPTSTGTWIRDGEMYEVTQTDDGEFWIKVADEEYIPGLLAGLADMRERWTQAPNAQAQATAGPKTTL